MPSPAGPAVPKLCVICGKDVAGQKRLKDSRGYVCYECAKQEQKRERGDRVRCRSCNRLVKEDSLVKLDGHRICNRCHAEKMRARKQQVKKIGIAGAQRRFERGRLYLMLGVAGLLLVIIVLSKLKILPSF